MPHDSTGVVLRIRENTVAGLLLSPCSRVQHEKLIGPHLVEKFPHFMESEGSLPRSHELPSFLSWAIRIQSTSSHLISSSPILILSSDEYVLVSFRWVSPAKPCMLSSPCVPHASPTSHFAVKSAHIQRVLVALSYGTASCLPISI